jgi:hypothetical protein
MKHKVSELEGALLDLAVAKIEKARGASIILGFGSAPCIEGGGGMPGSNVTTWKPSSLWEHGGPIIEREPWALPRLNTNPGALHLGKFAASTPGGFDYYGATPLIAAMRAYVASKLGDEVDLP